MKDQNRTGHNLKAQKFAWLEQVSENEWKFEFSKEKWKSDEKLDMAIEKMDSDPDVAKRIFSSLLNSYLYHFDAYQHLAIVLGHEKKYKGAMELRKIGVEFGFSLFPKKFDFNKDKLQWGWMENRPFLRLLHGLAVDYRYVLKDTKKESEIYEQLLKFDPEDHQGCRDLIVSCYLELELTDKVLELAKKYGKDFVSPAVPYAQVLTYLSLGKRDQAQSSMGHAINAFPYVAKQIVDKEHKKPKIDQDMEGYISVGGEDQAYYYWQEFGKYWESTEGAIAFVAEYL